MKRIPQTRQKMLRTQKKNCSLRRRENMAAATRGGVDRVLTKLKRNVEQGNYYEAHQMYRTLYFRYSNQNKYEEAINLLFEGATLLLQHNQQQSGVDLAFLLIETLKKSGFQVRQDHVEKLGRLLELISVNSNDRHNYVASAIKWSAGHKDSGHRSGHPELHKRFAVTFWHEKNYQMARYHFMHSSDGEGCALFLIEYHIVSGYPSEVDLFIAQAVLQYLCLSNRSCAETAFNCYTRRHPQVEKGPPFIRPMLNFLWLLLLSLEGGKVAVFTILCEQYQASLRRDPSYNDYLDKIGQLFFGLPPPQSSEAPGGLFGNLINTLLGGLCEDSGDEEEGGATGGGGVSIATAATPSTSNSRHVTQNFLQEDLD